MALYDEIKNPFDDDETLLKLINENSNNYHYNIYNRLTDDSNYSDTMHKDYLDKFNKYIKNPNLSRLYDYYANLDIEESDKEAEREIEAINNRTDIDDDKKYDKIIHYKKRHIYPLSEYKELLKKYSFAEIQNILDKYNVDNYRKEIFAINSNMYDDEAKRKAREKIKTENNLTDEQLDTIVLMYNFKDLLSISFNGGAGIMGFHVNPEHLNPKNRMRRNYKTDIKFYVNVGEDSYEFASLFQKKCEEEGIDYMYKVVDASRKEDKRSDRICIWASYEIADKFIDIIRKIKKEHPEFDYQKPPYTLGRIDDFIGVGRDLDSSYNVTISEIFVEASKNVFGDLKQKEIQELVSKDRSKLDELRSEMKKLAIKKGLDPNKMCVKNDAKDRLPQFYKTDNIFYIKIGNNYYIDRKTLELARSKNIDVLENPKIIINRNYYQITREQLIELDKVLDKDKENTTNKDNNIVNKPTVDNNNKPKVNTTNNINNTKVDTNTTNNNNNNNKTKVATSNKVIINKPITNNYIVVYTDKLTNKKYVKESDLGYKKNDPITILKNTCYEVSDEEINRLNKRIISITISIIRKTKTISTNTNNNTNINTNIDKNDQSTELIPGTNIPRPRNRGLYETDEEYVSFLRDYYDKVFEKKDKLNEMLNEQNTENDSKEKNK